MVTTATACPPQHSTQGTLAQACPHHLEDPESPKPRTRYALPVLSSGSYSSSFSSYSKYYPTWDKQ